MTEHKCDYLGCENVGVAVAGTVLEAGKIYPNLWDVPEQTIAHFCSEHIWHVHRCPTIAKHCSTATIGPYEPGQCVHCENGAQVMMFTPPMAISEVDILERLAREVQARLGLTDMEVIEILRIICKG